MHAVASFENKRRHTRSSGAKFFDYGPAVFFRQHDIDNEQIELPIARGAQPSSAIGRNIDLESGFTKSLGQKCRGLLFVFDDKDPHRSIYNTKKPLPRKRPFVKTVGAGFTAMRCQIVLEPAGYRNC